MELCLATSAYLTCVQPTLNSVVRGPTYEAAVWPSLAKPEEIMVGAVKLSVMALQLASLISVKLSLCVQNTCSSRCSEQLGWRD